MAKVLLAGGPGHIGGAVTDLLAERGTPFAVYDSLIYEPHYLRRVDFMRGDVRDRSKLISLLPGCTEGIWPAAILGDGACEVNPLLTVEVIYA
jgi:UDP-glucose 4-epimerase